MLDNDFNLMHTLPMKQANQNELNAINWVEANYPHLLGAEIRFGCTHMPYNVNGSYYRNQNLICLRRHRQGVRFYVETLVHELTHSKQLANNESEAYAAGYSAGYKFSVNIGG